MLTPTQKQIECCEGFGWIYVGNCKFMNDEFEGWFTERGFVKEFLEDIE